MQGVAVIVAVKHKYAAGEDSSLAQVWHGDLWGNREAKNAFLWDGNLVGSMPTLLPNKSPQFSFVPRNYDGEESYLDGFSVAQLMPENVTGIVTARDGMVIDFSQHELSSKIARFADKSKTDAEVRTEFFSTKRAEKYPLGDSRGWKVPAARKALQNSNWNADIRKLAYRPFDTRWVIYRPDMVDWGRFEHMQHVLAGPNISLLTTKAHRDDQFAHAAVSTEVSEVIGLSPRTASNSINFPLYLYPEEGTLETERRVNFDPKIYAEIKAKAGLQPSPPLGGEGRTAQPDGERGESADGGAYAHPSGIAHGSGAPTPPPPTPPIRRALRMALAPSPPAPLPLKGVRGVTPRLRQRRVCNPPHRLAMGRWQLAR
jgi:predicted helicase